MKHETKNTIEVLAWCNTCNRATRHSVSGKRRGHCLEHAPAGKSKEQEKRARQREAEEREPGLF